MKKTICVACALLACTVAQGASLPTDQIYTLGASTSVYFGKNGTSNVKDNGNAVLQWDMNVVSTPASNYLFTFSIAIADDKTFTADKAIVTTKNTNAGLVVNLNGTGTGISLAGGESLAVNASSGTYTLAYVNGYAKLFSGEVTDVATLTAADGWIYKGDNTDYYLQTWNGSGVSRAHSGEGVTTTLGNVTVVNVAAVPEPATATLSLLALAGLAARRRRR